MNDEADDGRRAGLAKVGAGASPVAGPATLQPCTETGPGSESQTYGAVTVEYRSGLSDAEIRGTYEVVARESGWRLVSDPSDRRLLFAFWPKYHDHYCHKFP